MRLTQNPRRTFLAWFLCFDQVLAAQTNIKQPTPTPPGNDTHSGNQLVCEPFGFCEPCPPDALAEPFCQPFGNRRLMHCRNATTSTTSPLPPSSNNVHIHQSSRQPVSTTEGETPAWEACGRIVSQERADFYEFVGCNILFAVVSIVIVFLRSRRLHAMQARQLAARIGLIRTGLGRR
ncbi:hypothetical protein K435DRAFT_679004 [Dendrothele bispora CBS 962.96]|uniref:Uncharacterized protein n=1 Tax=Dendrothele bispora (strain CBS 962.96) TaxID=1314807 RepID=A0A4S8LIF0_DENBC|nr:hypothetical protein K435DRAFT_679004 [Dendrothele bispora CBS 962.96]